MCVIMADIRMTSKEFRQITFVRTPEALVPEPQRDFLRKPDSVIVLATAEHFQRFCARNKRRSPQLIGV